MKKFFATAAVLFSATSTIAGELTYIAPDVTMIEAPATMGGSGAWLIPLIILAVLGIAFAHDPCNVPDGEKPSRECGPV